MIYMPKEQTLTSIDYDLKQEAKKAGFNISALTEQAIRKKLGKIQLEIDNPPELKCEFCGKIGERETPEDIKTKGHFSTPHKLTWLYPDEMWICEECLMAKSRNITK